MRSGISKRAVLQTAYPRLNGAGRKRERERGKEGGGGWDPERECFWLVWVGPVPTHTVLPRIQVHIKVYSTGG